MKDLFYELFMQFLLGYAWASYQCIYLSLFYLINLISLSKHLSPPGIYACKVYKIAFSQREATYTHSYNVSATSTPMYNSILFLHLGEICALSTLNVKQIIFYIKGNFFP